ncbi:Sortilin [Larimichthys crocea]|uniref:Uncharacterized protein n=1 Tax=Larimichthys crocea TaxID=215358 RepID=A0ACD3Q750_LARCR|nr:Sortilin [Larimichthys crocea]
MIWRLVVLVGVYLLLGAEGRTRDGRTVTFHRTQQDESQGQGRARPRRDISGSSGTLRPSHGPPFTSCRIPLTPTEHKVLDDNTHETGFNGDDGSYVILTWVGDGTGVVLVLSTFSAPIDTFLEGGSSRLYRSTDYGKSFHDISQRINNTFIKEEFGVSVGPGSSVILTADVPVLDNRGGIIFTSTDAGATFKFIQLPFHLAQPITYHFLNPDYLVALSIDGGLWLSLDFGAKWTKVHDGVHSFSWGAGINLFFSCSRVDTFEADERGDLVLKRTKDLGMTFTIIHEDIFSFGYIGAFLFFSVMEDSRSPRVMYFSSDQGDTFSQALLPSASTEQSMLNAMTWKHLWWFLCNNHESGLQHAKLPAVILRTCNLHIHGEHSRNNRIVPMLALSEPTAIGLVIAHDEGRCWKSYNFTEQPFFFAGLASEPGTKAMNVSVWGFRPEDDSQPMWVAVTIDFQSLITKECTAKDYEEWLAHSTDEVDSERNGCVLGVKETYRRLKRQSVCRNGRSFVVSKKQRPCLCIREDYICDYGYYRHVNTSECVRQSNTNKTLELCLNGEEDELLTAGYRKVPSDRCEGGFTPQLIDQTVIRPCGVKTSPAPPAKSSSPVTHFDTPRERLVLILVCAVAAVVVLIAVISAIFAVRRGLPKQDTSVPFLQPPDSG